MRDARIERYRILCAWCLVGLEQKIVSGTRRRGARGFRRGRDVNSNSKCRREIYGEATRLERRIESRRLVEDYSTHEYVLVTRIACTASEVPAVRGQRIDTWFFLCLQKHTNEASRRKCVSSVSLLGVHPGRYLENEYEIYHCTLT